MRRLVVNTLALAVMLAGVSIGLGQQQSPPAKREVKEEETPRGKRKPIRVEEEEDAKSIWPQKKSKLEQMLAEALKNNPDIRVAAARVDKAEAELNRTRLQVTQQVVALYYAIDTQKKTVALQEEKNEYLERRFKTGQGTMEGIVDGRQALTLAKAKLAELEAQLPALLGKAHGNAAVHESNVRQRAADALEQMLYANRVTAAETLLRQVHEQHKPAGPMADRIRKALEKPVSLKVSNVDVSDVILQLQKMSDVTFKLMSDGLPEPRVSLELADLSLLAVLQFLEDSEPGYRFVVREYGILFAPQAKLPPGAITVQEFVHPRPAGSEKTPEKESEAKRPPSEEVEGRVTSVEGSDLVRIGLGIKDGVKTGDVVEIYRLDPKPIYLGSLTIVQSLAKEAIGKPRGRMGAIQVGDRVISKKPRPMNQFRSPSESKPGE